MKIDPSLIHICLEKVTVTVDFSWLFTVIFQTYLQSLKIRCELDFRICKPVCKLSIWMASLSSRANHGLCLQTSLWILKWTLNFAMNFLTSHWSLEYYSETLSEITGCEIMVIWVWKNGYLGVKELTLQGTKCCFLMSIATWFDVT